MLKIILILFFIAPYLFADSLRDNFVNGDSSYSQREIEKIKDSVVNTRLQLKMFQEILEKEGIEQSYPKIEIRFSNNLSQRYRIYSIEYILDGVRTYYYQASDKELTRKSASENIIQNYTANLAPGKHELQVIVNFLGNDKGIFSYLSEYKVQMLEKKSVNLDKNTNYSIDIKAYEKGGLLADFKEKAKLDIAFQKVTN